MKIQTSRQFFAKLASRRLSRVLRAVGIGGVLFTSYVAHAAVIEKDNNNTNLSLGTSYVGGVIPGAADTLLFDSVVTSALTVNQGGGSGTNQSFGNIQVTNPGGAITINQNGTNTVFTLNISGTAIDMSAATQDLTFLSGSVRVATANFNPLFTVAAGRTLTLNSLTNQGNTKTVFFTGPGNIVINGAAGAGGATSFILNGGSTTTLNGTGGFVTGNVIAGTLNLGNDAAVGTANTLNLGGANANTPTIAATGGARTIGNNVVLLATSVGGNPTIAGANALTVNGAVTVSGADRTLSVNNTALTTLGGTVNLSEGATNRTLTINGTGNTTISGAVVNGGTATASALTYAGTGTLTLSAANSYGGLTTVSSGTLNINGVNALGGANYAGLTLNGGRLQYATGATGNGSLDVSNIGGVARPVTFGAGGATIDTNGNAVAFANTVGNGGAGSLTKVGTGTLTLGAANTYAGGTFINVGMLTATTNGSLGTGNVTLAANTTLELGTGVTLAHNGTLMTTLTLTDATTSIVQLDGPTGTSQDTVQALIIAGVAFPNGTYGALGSGATFVLPDFTGTGLLTVVPEPGTWVFLSGGMAGLAALAVRRRRAA